MAFVAQTVLNASPVGSTQTKRPADPRYEIDRSNGSLRLKGDLCIDDAAAIWQRLSSEVAEVEGEKTEIDLSAVTRIDGAIMSLLVQARAELSERGVQAEIVGASQRTLELVRLYGGDDEPARRTRRKAEGFVEHVGRATVEGWGELVGVVSFLGTMVVAAVGVLRRPKSGNFGEIPALVEKAGLDAVPIVVLLNFLMGFVMGFQAARQLETYGGSIYVADLVGISATRELAPLMTAIILCGRSGAAYAAEIGTMRVSQELDALRTMGMDPVPFLVFPRTVALMVVLPVLTLLGDIVGILGGLLVAVTTLKLSATAYLHESSIAIVPSDVASGLVKSAAFALAIGLIACQQGFATTGGAKGVGRRTTSTVVTSLFAIVLVDAVFTVFFRAVGV